jgi:hypothetical protein
MQRGVEAGPRSSRETGERRVRHSRSQCRHAAGRERRERIGGPGYVRLVHADITGLGADVRLSATFSAALPIRMASKSYYWIVSWNLTGESAHATWGLSAQATNRGWSVAAGNDHGDVRYPGTLAVSGNTVALTFPWTFVDGPGPFTWSASASWFDTASGPGGYYAQDIPQAHFPT